jgi:hypothetical protein
VYYENLLERAKKLIYYDTGSITHTHKQETCLYSMHVENYPERAEILALPYEADIFMISETSNLGKHVK